MRTTSIASSRVAIGFGLAGALKPIAVGSVERAPTAPDVTTLELLVGDRYLVCSDGLSDLLDEDAIAACLGSTDPEQAAQRQQAEAERHRQPAVQLRNVARRLDAELGR